MVCRQYCATNIELSTFLPPVRTTEADTFNVIGVDFASPLYVKERAVQVKAYIVLFTCAVTRAVHLELVSDMTTESFLRAFSLFVARRGLCKTVSFG